MAYNFLTLVNDINSRVNEVPLTSANFAAADGFYSTAKEAVNSSIRDINQMDYKWPFNHTTYTETLVAGTMRYAYQADCKSMDYDTFRVQRDGTFGNDTQWLQRIDYNDFIKRFADDEYNTTDTGIRGLPIFITQAPSLEYLVHPAPDQAYALDYEYYTLPVDLEAYTDAPSIPVSFRHIITDGAMYYVYYFRNDMEAAERHLAKFKEGIKAQRGIYINRYDAIRDTRVGHQSVGDNKTLRVS